jgi:hypothetical protein
VQIKGKRPLALLIGVALVASAVMRELLKPPAERHWHGQLGVLPYDLRFPTWARIRTTLWNPSDPHVLKSKVFGVGWDVNFGAIARKAGVA